MASVFISFTSGDRAWADWIAWHLEEAGHTVTYQPWDFRPGTDFVGCMQRAADESDHTVAVMTPDYCMSEIAQSEWRAAFAKDPGGILRKLIPVRVADFRPPAILATRVYVDLVGVSQEEAQERLIGALSQGRDKPEAPPGFPAESHPQKRDVPGYPPQMARPGNQELISHFGGTFHIEQQIVGPTTIVNEDGSERRLQDAVAEASRSLRARDADLAAKAAQRALDISGESALANLLLGASLLSGTVAALSPKTIKRAESALERVHGDDDLHVCAEFLLAVLKHDGYKMHGLRESAPTYEELSSRLADRRVPDGCRWLLAGVVPSDALAKWWASKGEY